jgi:hypothetical protein
MFAELQSHYLFEDKFGRPGKGNDKGKVEGLVGFSSRNFMTPLPVADSLSSVNKADFSCADHAVVGSGGWHSGRSIATSSRPAAKAGAS